MKTATVNFADNTYQLKADGLNLNGQVEEK